MSIFNLVEHSSTEWSSVVCCYYFCLLVCFVCFFFIFFIFVFVSLSACFLDGVVPFCEFQNTTILLQIRIWIDPILGDDACFVLFCFVLFIFLNLLLHTVVLQISCQSKLHCRPLWFCFILFCFCFLLCFLFFKYLVLINPIHHYILYAWTLNVTYFAFQQHPGKLIFNVGIVPFWMRFSSVTIHEQFILYKLSMKQVKSSTWKGVEAVKYQEKYFLNTSIK